MTKNDGTRLQGILQQALQAFQERTPSFFHRFADTRSARAFLQVQPGDFLWLLPGLPAILIEAKSTEVGASLVSLMTSGQCGKHRLWHRARHTSAFVYADFSRDLLEWHDGKQALTHKSTALWVGDVSEAHKMLSYMKDFYHA